jgi:hypothetical protein
MISVRVRGAREQVDDLIAAVRATPMSPGARSAMAGTLQVAGFWLDAGRPTYANLALEVFVFEVRAFRSAGLLDAALAQDWTDAARRIQSVVGMQLLRKWRHHGDR